MILNRFNFSNLLADNKLFGYAVEVGNHKGEFCAPFYSRWEGKLFYCVDHYVTDKGVVHWQDYAALEERMIATGKPWKFIGKESSVASTYFPDNFFDFIYLDAGHNYDSISKDLRCWWPKLRSGGIFAGHDFFNGSHGNHKINPKLAEVKKFTYGVRFAVMEFAKQIGLEVSTTKDKREGISWYWFKP